MLDCPMARVILDRRTLGLTRRFALPVALVIAKDHAAGTTPRVRGARTSVSTRWVAAREKPPP